MLSKNSTFRIMGDHTLGNALKHIIAGLESVDFCGYSMPHPSEPVIFFRIQSERDTAINIMKTGLKIFKQITEDTLISFEEQLSNFEKNQNDQLSVK